MNGVWGDGRRDRGAGAQKIGVSALDLTVSPPPFCCGGSFKFYSSLQIFPHRFSHKFLKCSPLINGFVLEGLNQICR
jgi:hypothetical protein